MNEVIIPLLIVVTELGLIIALIAGYVFFVFVRKQKDRRAVAQQFVSKVNQNETDRERHLRTLINHISAHDDEAVEKGLADLMKREKALYSRVLKGVVGNNADILLQLDDDVRNLLTSYTALVSLGVRMDSDVARKALEDMQHRVDEFQQEISALEEEKKELRGLLDRSRTEMDEVLSEYSSMYSGGKRK